MEVTFNVFRGSADGSIKTDTITRTLEDHEVFVETTHSGLCGTDEHYLKSGQVLGHEGIGIIRGIGKDVHSVQVGDRVGFGYTHEVCADCDNCLTGKPSPAQPSLFSSSLLVSNRLLMPYRMGPVLQKH